MKPKFNANCLKKYRFAAVNAFVLIAATIPLFIKCQEALQNNDCFPSGRFPKSWKVTQKRKMKEGIFLRVAGKGTAERGISPSPTPLPRRGEEALGHSLLEERMSAVS